MLKTCQVQETVWKLVLWQHMAVVFQSLDDLPYSELLLSWVSMLPKQWSFLRTYRFCQRHSQSVRICNPSGWTIICVFTAGITKIQSSLCPYEWHWRDCMGDLGYLVCEATAWKTLACVLSRTCAKNVTAQGRWKDGTHLYWSCPILSSVLLYCDSSCLSLVETRSWVSQK